MSKVLVSETNLTAIADAIRTKKGSEDTYKPGEMAAAINSITTGGGGEGLPEGALTLTGNCKYRFYGGGWDWFLENYGSQITCDNITGAESMFEECNLSEIPLELKASSKPIIVNEMFYNCNNLTKAPTLASTFKPYDNTANCMFQHCFKLKTFPKYFFAYFTFNDYKYGGADCHSMFRKCYSLEKLPDNLFTVVDKYLPDGTEVTTPAITYVDNGMDMFCECIRLRKIENLPAYGKYGSVAQSYEEIYFNAFNALYMLDTLTFGNITTKSNLTNQIIDLTNNVGCAAYMLPDGFDINKRVTNETNYQALKNTEDWWTDTKKYSRYNKTSAETTVMSLPRLVDGYTSTIKFDGNCGSLTDGGAINTMNEEVIAVAAVRGWTVAFV